MDSQTEHPYHGYAPPNPQPLPAPPPALRDSAPMPADSTQTSLFSTIVGTLIGPYRIGARVGGGAMASVYRALDTRDNRTVALKILLPDADETVRERFRQEARTVSILDHPNIVHTLEVGHATDSAGFTYIAMEMVEGESLGELLERVRALNAVDSCALLAPIAQALAYAHNKSIVHRDVKPSNILLRRAAPGEEGSVRLSVLDGPVTPLLSDFGIARALDAPELTSMGRTIGTPSYMSPEQCAGNRDIDGRADIYSLGAVLYRCLVGRAPFVGATTQILYAHVYEPVTVPDDVVRTLAPIVLETLRTALAKEPDDRYPSADDLARVLSHNAGPIHLTATAVEPGTPDQLTMTMSELESATPIPPTTSSQVLVPAPARHAPRPNTPRPNTPRPNTPRPNTQPASPPATQPAVQPVHQAQWNPANPAHPRANNAPAPPVINVGKTGGVQARYKATQNTVAPPVAVPAARIGVAVSQPGPIPAQRKRRGALIALLLAVPLFIMLGFVTAALLDLWPSVDPQTTLIPAAPDNAPDNATEIAIVPPTDALPADTPAEAPVVAATDAAADTTAEPPADNATPAPATTTTPATTPATDAETPAATPEATITLPTPAGDVAEIWANAQAFYAERDWDSAMEWLTYVQRIDPGFEQDTANAMRASILVQRATNATSAGDYEQALDLLNQALEITPANFLLTTLQRSTETYLSVDSSADEATRDDAARQLYEAHEAYANSLARANLSCDAAEHLQAAGSISPDDTITARAAALSDECNRRLAAAAIEAMLTSLEGRILYSTQIEDGSYRVYIVEAHPDASPAYIIDDARQPALAPDGVTIAFHSTRNDSAGIAGFRLGQGLDPSTRAQQYTRDPLDARDSAPAWNPQGTRLVFGSAIENGPRILTVGSSGAGDRADMGLGQSPAWAATANWIAYNGLDDAGQEPGLWLIRPDASGKIRLTDNGTDIRPAWTPDSSRIVFMSNGRSGNWDVFTVSTDTGVITQITNDPAQDGLPVISPDGNFIAFASDRGGDWNIWITPIDGGEAQRLMPFQGTLTNWLEHSLQWTN